MSNDRFEAKVLDSLFTFHETSDIERIFGGPEEKCDINVAGVRNLLDRHPHVTFTAKVTRRFCNRRKFLEIDGFVLGSMIDHDYHFDSFRDQEMYS